MRSRNLPLMFLVLFSVTQLSCTSTTLTASWSDPTYPNRPITSVLVLGISENPTTARLYDDTFVTRLKQENVKAVPGYAHLPSDEKPERAAIEAAIESTGMSTVLITRLVGVSKKTQYHPSRGSSYSGSYGGMYGYYSTAYRETYSPGYYSTYEVHKLVSLLYDSATAKLIWSAESETIDPDNVNLVITDLVNLLIQDLREKKLL